MANRLQPQPDNAPGAWFVDQSCIDCGVCRWVAPSTFGEAEDHAFVSEQPMEGATAVIAAAGRAAIACPVGSIGGPAEALRAATEAFPYPLFSDGLPEVYFCGWASRETYGATAWLLRHPAGNVLVDVPRANARLFDRIEALGGVRWLLLTHRDDVAGHRLIRARFGAERILHRDDLEPDTADVEHVLEGEERLAPDLLLLPLPGHTRGSVGLLYGDRVLFSGDHLWGAGPLGWHAEGRAPALPHPFGAGRSVCWWSWPRQIESMERLLQHPFHHVLPGHGRPWHGGEAARRPALEALIAWMKTASVAG